MEQVIRSLPQAFRIIKEMGLSEEEGSDYRSLARESLKGILEYRMRDRVDRYLEAMSCRDEEDRRNGHFQRHLLTELGGILIDVPRMRRMSAVGVIQAYSRRAVQVDRCLGIIYEEGEPIVAAYFRGRC